MGFGFLGSAPTKLWSYFSIAKLKYDMTLKYGMTYDFDQFEKKLKKHKYGIFSCWNSYPVGSLHTFMVEYKNGKFSSHNGYTGISTANSLATLTKHHKMIVGYWFKNIPQ